MVESTQDKTVVFAKFLGKEILGEWGRLLFSLLDAFAMSGYEIALFDNLPRAELGKYGPLTLTLPNLTLTEAIPSDTGNMFYLFDREDRAVGGRPWRKKIQVKFDVFAPYWFSKPIIMPYPVHPVHAGFDLPERLKDLRPVERKMRIFFSGETAGYVKNRIHFPKDKLPRLDIVNAIVGKMGEELLQLKHEEDLVDLVARAGFSNKFVLGVPGSFRVNSGNWLKTLATADFFLCPPGYIMPMCHNAVEAMAVGAIPIINYPEWFDPGLEHLKNCIAFDDASDLISKLHAVIRMGAEPVRIMRQNVIDYYERRLTQSSFVRQIESSGRRNETVLMITDANVLARSGQLNRHSILVRGTASHGILALFGPMR